jgi:hypothetical protein
MRSLPDSDLYWQFPDKQVYSPNLIKPAPDLYGRFFILWVPWPDNKALKPGRTDAWLRGYRLFAGSRKRVIPVEPGYGRMQTGLHTTMRLPRLFSDLPFSIVSSKSLNDIFVDSHIPGFLGFQFCMDSSC